MASVILMDPQHICKYIWAFYKPFPTMLSTPALCEERKGSL